MSEEQREYVMFTVTTKDGREVELAAVDEFDYEHKHYVVGALVEGDVVKEEDGVFIYRVKTIQDEFVMEKIASAREYEEIAAAYMEMSQE